ncbi:MAG: hypothetical protein KZQ92_11555 [Candidatus Thiodiazotropha sp. (ex Lucinoma borealis)]|nr:hypothetical protein [Candidatus Thiodiazotropha sp. (ex Lucinoma borealis)]MCU7864596.1 hypothetical protein [Candidatus Thiodiazotropha sp. (ex Lucinoma borealis)]MCU7867299.1 hypothetical protein [Candidatus Thiodiazotropha sp. (ex Lucinoma borealis)]
MLKKDKKCISIEHLCDDSWEMPEQINTLYTWLKENNGKITKGKFIADIGYSPREGALGGGVALSIEAMEIMVSMGMELYLSEYPPSEGE